VAVDLGTGIATSPFGARSMFSYTEDLSLSGSSYSGDPALLNTGTIAMGDGSDAGQFVSGGAWVDADGQAGAQATVGTGLVTTESQLVGVEGLGTGSWEL